MPPSPSLADLIVVSEDWLMARILEYARQRDYTRYTSTLKEAWRLSISGLSSSLVQALEAGSDLELGPDDDYVSDPAAAFGVLEARLHRERGITLPMFLGLMKYYRQSYQDLLNHHQRPDRERIRVERFFDRVEIAFCAEWTQADHYHRMGNLMTRSRFLTNEKNKYLTIFESQPHPILFVTPDGRVENLNHAASRLFGVASVPGEPYYRSAEARYLAGLKTDPEAIPAPFVGWASDLMPWLTELSGFVAGGESVVFLEKEVEMAGEPRHYRIHLARMLDVSGKYGGVVVSLEDQTAMKLAEQRARRAEKMEALGTLAGGIAHDFNNILSAIIGFSELALEDVHPGTLLSSNIGEILMAGKRAKYLARQILVFAGGADPIHRPLKVAEGVTGALRLIQASLPASVHLETDIGGNAHIKADSSQLHQVILHLCENALQAMATRGEGCLTVTVREVAPDREVEILVSDNGPGIPLEIQERIFDPYFSTKERGKASGMGLAVVRAIVTSWGGQVSVESRPGQGSRFRIRVPAVEPPLPEEPKPRSRAPSFPGTGILLVDDDPAVAAAARQMLERLGCRVSVSSGGQAAMTQFSRDPNRFDLVITDAAMPDMTGEHLARAIRAVRPDLPVVLFGGSSQSPLPERGQGVAFQAFLAKPLEMEDLTATLHAALGA